MGCPGPPAASRGTCLPARAGLRFGGSQEPSKGPSRGFQALQACLDRGLVVGFAFLGCRPLPPPADPGIQRFQANLLGWSGRVPSGAPGRTSRSTRSLGLGFLFNSPEKGGPLGRATAPAPGGAAHALHNSLGLHSSSKLWCEWLPGMCLGPGTLEKGGYGLSRPGWEFRV